MISGATTLFLFEKRGGYMADYSVDIQAKLSGFEKLDVIEKQINALKNKNIKIGIEIDRKNLNSKNIGKQIQSVINNPIKNVKINPDNFYDNWIKQEKKVVKEAKRLNKNFSKELTELNTDDVDKNAIKAAKARIATETKAEKEYLKEQKKLSNIREKEADSYYSPRKEAYQSIGKKSDIQKQMSAYYQELEIQSARQAEEYAKIIAKTRDKVLNGSYDAKSSSMTAKLDAYSGQDNKLINAAHKEAEIYNNTLTKLRNHFDSNNPFSLKDEEIVKSFSNMTLAAERFENTMTQIRNTQSKSLDIGVAERSANAVKKYYDENSKAVKKYGIELKALENQYRQATTVAEKSKLDNQFKNLKATISAEGLTGKSIFTELGRGFKQIGQFAVTYGAIQRIPYLLKRMANATLEVDTAMTELRKVSDASDRQLNNYFEHAAVSAKKYGAVISDVISSAADWNRLGYTLEDSKSLADLTTLYQRVGDNMTQESASQSLVSTLQGFKMTAEEANHIVDAFNEVGNTFAIGSDGIGESLKRSASSMYAAGNTMEQTIGLVTAANEVVQDPDSVGTAFKTISMRIRGAETEMEQLGLDTDGMVESTAKLQEEIMALTGVDIMKDKDTFKSTYDILDELSSKWQNLTDIQQASVTELIAGKRQGNIISALMNNFDTAREATQTAKNADGSAEKELKNYQKSMQYSIDVFKAQFQELSTTALSSDFLKGAIDAGTGLLNVLTQIVDVGGTVPLILGAIGGVKLFTNLDHQKVLKIPIFLSWSSIGKEMIKWFKLQVYVFGSFKINQRGVIAGTHS